MAHYSDRGIGVTGAILFGAIILLAFPNRALALATEHFGNSPVPPGWAEIGKDVLPVANLNSRVYWREVNGDPQFFYRGNTEALNEALRRFAAIGDEVREVVLLPGPGETTTLSGKNRIPCDWSFHPPYGFYLVDARREKGTNVFTKHPTLTIYVNVSGPPTPVDGKQIERWIKDLDSAEFQARDQASRELEKLDNAAGPTLRRVLACKPSLEVRRRIEMLLEKMEGIDLDQVKIPAGITVLESKDLLDRYVQGLKSSDAYVRGHAAGSLGSVAPYTDKAVPVLLEMLKKDKHEYVRRCAAGALARLGKRSGAALPILKEGLQDPDVNIRNMFQQAVTMIEQAKEEPENKQEVEKRRAIQNSIGRFRKAFQQTSSK